MSIEKSEKFWHIPGDLEAHTHMQAQKTEKILISYLQIILSLYTTIKWRLRQSYKLM